MATQQQVAPQQNVKQEVHYSVFGVVDQVTKTTTPGVFRMTTESGDIQCVCPFFKPVQEGDFVFGKVKIYNPQQRIFEFVSPPYVQLPQDENHIKKCFILALRTSGFGGIQADNLYAKICELVNISRMVKHVPSLSSLSAPSSGEPETKTFSPITPEEVIVYMDESSVMFYRNKSDKPIEAIVAGTTLKEEAVKSLLEWWYRKRYMRRLYLLGLTNTEIKACHMTPDEIYKICVGDTKKDPKDIGNAFRLPAIPMDKAYGIFRMRGHEPDPIQVKCGEIVRKIKDYMDGNGWTCTPLWLLQKAYPTFHALRDTLEKDYFTTFEHMAAYLRYPLKVEREVAQNIDTLIKRTAEKLNALHTADTPNIESAFWFSKTLTEDQKIAVQGSLDHEISIITGGPGTGKTTICKEIVQNLEAREIPYFVTSFTGKAVSRIHDALGSKKACTIDRLIMRAHEVDRFVHIIIDEASMVTTELYYRLLHALPKGFKLTLIGDIDQLQPISWGTFMAQIMSSERVPTYRLTKNFRIQPNPTTLEEKAEIERKQAAGEEVEAGQAILKNANGLIAKGRDLGQPFMFENGDGFWQVEGGLPMVKHIVNQLKSGGFGKEDITVISPYNEYVPQINAIFEELFLSGNERRMDCENTQWVEGCRVMMTQNNYDIGVMNGEEGYATRVSDEGVEVTFKDDVAHTFKYVSPDKDKTRGSYKTLTKVGEALEGEDIEGKNLDTDFLSKSFGITVHKSQGSEQKYVIVFIPMRFNNSGRVSKFLNINLLYTALTRAKLQVFLVGSQVAINQTTCQIQQKRCDNLGLRLKAEVDKEFEAHLTTLIQEQNDRFKAAMGVDKLPEPEDDFDPYDDCGDADACFMDASYFDL